MKTNLFPSVICSKPPLLRCGWRGIISSLGFVVLSVVSLTLAGCGSGGGAE